MTSLGLAQRLLRHLKFKDWGEMPIEAQLEIVDALNVALAIYFAEAPETYRRLNLSYLLAGPQTVTITTTNGSKTVSDTPFANYTRGAMLRIEGDDQWNRIDGDSQLLMPYLGLSGSHTATVYGDVTALGFNEIERVITWPQLNNGSVLALDESMRERPGRFFRDLGDLASGVDYDTGCPRWHIFDYLNDLTAGRNEKAGLLRVYPLPDQDYTIRFEAIVAPLHLSLSAINTSVDLPVRNYHAERFLVPLALRELAHGGLWEREDTRRSTQVRGDTAETNLETINHEIGTPANRLGTPKGY